MCCLNKLAQNRQKKETFNCLLTTQTYSKQKHKCQGEMTVSAKSVYKIWQAKCSASETLLAWYDTELEQNVAAPS